MFRPLIGISGKAGSGKSTAAEYLIRERECVRHSFAHNLKWASYFIFGFSVSQRNGSEKNTIDPRWGISPREAFQRFGTVVRTEFGPDVWVRSLQTALEALPAGVPVVIDDVRYVNEAEWIRSRGGLLVRLERPDNDSGIGASRETHTSETALDEWQDWDLYYINNGYSTELRDAVVALYDDHYQGVVQI